jgi:hypothetical protein
LTVPSEIFMVGYLELQVVDVAEDEDEALATGEAVDAAGGHLAQFARPGQRRVGGGRDMELVQALRALELPPLPRVLPVVIDTKVLGS